MPTNVYIGLFLALELGTIPIHYTRYLIFFNTAANHFLSKGFLNHLVILSLLPPTQLACDLVERLVRIHVPDAGAERVQQRRGGEWEIAKAQPFVVLGVGIANVHDHMPVRQLPVKKIGENFLLHADQRCTPRRVGYVALPFYSFLLTHRTYAMW